MKNQNLPVSVLVVNYVSIKVQQDSIQWTRIVRYNIWGVKKKKNWPEESKTEKMSHFMYTARSQIFFKVNWNMHVTYVSGLACT